MRDTIARYLGSRFAPAMAAGVTLESRDSRLVMAGGPPEGDEVGGRGGSGNVALSGSCEEALRLRGFANGLGTGGLGNDWLSGGGVTGVNGFTADIIAAIWALGLGLKTMKVDLRVDIGGCMLDREDRAVV